MRYGLAVFAAFTSCCWGCTTASPRVGVPNIDATLSEGATVAALAAEGGVGVTGGNLFYRSAGLGTPVLLLHGYSIASPIWEPYILDLATEYQVIAFDLPGHGRSERVDTIFSHRGAAAMLLEALKQLDVGPAHIVGHSSGALIAVELALQRPEQVLSLVTIATPWEVPESLRELGREVTYETVPPSMMEALRSWHPHGEPQIRWLMEQQRRMSVDPTEMLLGRNQLTRLQMPMLVVHGDSDRLLPLETALELFRTAPNASLLVLPGAGHELILTGGHASRLLMVALTQFLADQAARR